MKFKRGDKAIVTEDQYYEDGGRYYKGAVVDIMYEKNTDEGWIYLTADRRVIPEDSLMSVELKHYDEVVNRSASRFAEELVTTSSKKCDCGAHAVGSEMHDDFCSLYKEVK